MAFKEKEVFKEQGEAKESLLKAYKKLTNYRDDFLINLKVLRQHL